MISSQPSKYDQLILKVEEIGTRRFRDIKISHLTTTSLLRAKKGVGITKIIMQCVLGYPNLGNRNFRLSEQSSHMYSFLYEYVVLVQVCIIVCVCTSFVMSRVLAAKTKVKGWYFPA